MATYLYINNILTPYNLGTELSTPVRATFFVSDEPLREHERWFTIEYAYKYEQPIGDTQDIQFRQDDTTVFEVPYQNNIKRYIIQLQITKNATNPKQITANLNMYSNIVGKNLNNKNANAINPITSNINLPSHMVQLYQKVQQVFDLQSLHHAQ